MAWDRKCISACVLRVLHPFNAGEVLGCTAPAVDQSTDAIVFVADGRFHLEAIMIANPAISAYRHACLDLAPLQGGPDVPACTNMYIQFEGHSMMVPSSSKLV